MKKILIMIALITFARTNNMSRLITFSKIPLIKQQIIYIPYRYCSSQNKGNALHSFKEQHLINQRAMICAHLLSKPCIRKRNKKACKKYLNWWTSKFTDTDIDEYNIITAIDPDYFAKDQAAAGW